MDSEKCVHDSGDDGVEQSEITARDEDEAEDDAGERGESLPVRPLDALQLGPDCDQELYDTRALSVGLAILAAATAGRVRAVAVVFVLADLPVLDLLPGLFQVGRRRVVLVRGGLVELLLVAQDLPAEPLVLRRRADRELGRDGRRRLNRRRVVDDRVLAPALAVGRRGLPLLLQAFRAALGLTLLCSLAVACHTGSGSQRVSLLGVCLEHHRQYLRISMRSGVFRFDFSVW